jgi:Predicted phosphatases
MVKKYKHIIWDWNGTIFNDVDLCVELINDLLKQQNLKTLSLNEYREVFTIPVKDYYTKIGFDFSIEPFEIIGKKWMDEYERRKYECGLYENIKSILNKIQSLNISQSILSAYSQHTLNDLVKYYELDGNFTHVVGLDNIYAASKIAIARDLMQRIGVRKGESLLIGDTLHDFEVAKEIGADCVLLASGHQSFNKLKNGIANESGVAVISSLDDLLLNAS